MCKYGRGSLQLFLPLLFGKNPRLHHKGSTGRVLTGDQRLPDHAIANLDKTSPVGNCVSTTMG